MIKGLYICSYIEILLKNWMIFKLKKLRKNYKLSNKIYNHVCYSIFLDIIFILKNYLYTKILRVFQKNLNKSHNLTDYNSLFHKKYSSVFYIRYAMQDVSISLQKSITLIKDKQIHKPHTNFIEIRPTQLKLIT